MEVATGPFTLLLTVPACAGPLLLLFTVPGCAGPFMLLFVMPPVCWAGSAGVKPTRLGLVAAHAHTKLLLVL